MIDVAINWRAPLCACSILLFTMITACTGDSVENAVDTAINPSASVRPAPVIPASVNFRNPPSTPEAVCGEGSVPETGLQGQVSRDDHRSGRATEGFKCNAELVGKHARDFSIGTVAGFKVERYVDKAGRECAYYDSTLLFPTNILDGKFGVIVLDMSDPSNPLETAALTSPAMLSPHESLVLNQERGVLAAVAGVVTLTSGMLDLYDVSEDCRYPKLMSSTSTGLEGHESGISPDGLTFFVASASANTLGAFDIADLSLPKMLWVGAYASHGLNVSDDSTRAYVTTLDDNAGLYILDISEIKGRKPNPKVREVSYLSWQAASIPQNAIPFTSGGREFLLEVDEYSTDKPGGVPGSFRSNNGAARIIDITDEEKPFVASNLRLQVHDLENRDRLSKDPGFYNIVGGYGAHYCNLPTRDNPKIAACSMLISGLRIFDISDPYSPREIAYFNAPVTPRVVPIPARSSNLAQSSPTFVPERKEVWYSDGFSGFYAVRLTNGVW